MKIAEEADTDAVAARLEALGRTAAGYELSVRQPPSFLEHFFPQKTSDFDVRLNGEGLLPMALSTGQGAELHPPMAWVIIGGLTLATGLTLIVVPVIYSLVCGRGRS